MPSTIEQAKEAIFKYGGKASKHQIARELKISLEYTGLICKDLERKGEIAFSDGFYYLSSGRDVVTNKGQETLLATSKKPAPRKLRRPKRARKTAKTATKINSSPPLISILGISKSLAYALEKAGYTTVESLAEAPISMLMEKAKLELHAAAQLINQARKIK